MNKRDILLGLFVVIVWAGNAVALKFITNEIPPFTGMTLRIAVTSAIFLPFIRWPGRENFWQLVQVSLLMCFFHWGSLIWSVARLDASIAVILLQMQIIFSVILGRLFFTEKFGWRTALGMTIGFMGVLILVGTPANPPDILGVAGIVFTCVAIAFAYARMKTLKNIKPLNYIAHLHFWALIPAILMTFAFENPTQIPWENVNINIVIGVIVYQILVAIVHMVWQRLIGRNDMGVLTTMTFLIPFFGVSFAVLLLGESLTWPMLSGGLLTMLGVGVIIWRKQVKMKT